MTRVVNRAQSPRGTPIMNPITNKIITCYPCELRQERNAREGGIIRSEKNKCKYIPTFPSLKSGDSVPRISLTFLRPSSIMLFTDLQSLNINISYFNPLSVFDQPDCCL
ncbi:hypothetical protein RF11_01434 [Thelohanellus kitauei]|uniref:Uncharacterized protein n=1 Tax=Thelohanellus kitauei TaxID=669202 RepID=A0A0C2MP87_THEKT|nr:hypothetical protein RF11_01434 [Thelohanellus kitauei]